MTSSQVEMLKNEWHALEANIHFIESLIPGEDTRENSILSIAEEIKQVNESLHLLTIKTLNTILNINEHFDECPRCKCQMDVQGTQLICENPVCPTNDYIPNISIDRRSNQDDRRKTIVKIIDRRTGERRI